MVSLLDFLLIFLGIGKIRRMFMKDSIGVEGHNILKGLKKAIDPNGIF